MFICIHVQKIVFFNIKFEGTLILFVRIYKVYQRKHKMSKNISKSRIFHQIWSYTQVGYIINIFSLNFGKKHI